jgi:peptidyl-prolyl cis-trans isomerase SurA
MFRPHRLRLLVMLVVAAGLFQLGHKPARAQTEQLIEVLVNDEPITNFDITQRMRLMTVTRRAQPTEKLRKKIIEELVSERIQLQQANKDGVAVSEDQVDEVFGRVAKSNNLSSEQLAASLAQLGVNAKTMKDQIRARLAWQQVVRRKFRGQVSVNASQVDKAISDEEPAEDQKKATEFQLQRVRLELPSSPDQRQIANRVVEADRLRTRVRTCTNLEDVVKPLRKASVKSVGRRSAEQVAQPARAILLATAQGQATPPIITSSGVELYVVCAKRSVNRNDEQRQKVRSKLMSEEYDILARRHLRDLRQEAFVEYR